MTAFLAIHHKVQEITSKKEVVRIFQNLEIIRHQIPVTWKKKWRNCFEIAILESPIALQKVPRASPVSMCQQPGAQRGTLDTGLRN